jgi:hypothetical protein
VETYTGHKKEITCVRFSPDGKWVVSAAKDGQLLFYDLVASKHINTIKIPPAYVTSFEFNPTEFSLAAITSARNVRFWDLDTMTATFNTPPESQAVKAITYSNLGNQLFMSAKSSLKIWDIDSSLKLQENIEVGWDNLAEMRIVNNDQMVAVSYMSNFVSVWELDLSAYLSEEHQDDDDRPNEMSVEPPQQKAAAPSSADYYDRPASNRTQPPLQEKSQSKDVDGPAYSNNVQRRMAESSAAQQEDYLAQGKGRFSYPAAQSIKDVPLNDLKAIAEDADLKMNYEEDEKNVPEVVPEEGYSEDMATSMGESFWKRFQNSLAAGNADREREGRDRDPIKVSNALEQLLPPSSFDDPPVPSERQSGRSTSNKSNPAPPDISRLPSTSPALKVLSRRESKGAAENPPVTVVAGPRVTSGGYNNVNYGNISEVESKGIEGLAVVGSRHANQPARPVTGSGPPPPLAISANTAQENETARCHDLLDRLLAGSNSVSGHLSQRLGTLKMLRQLWSKGDVLETLDHLSLLSEAMKLNNLQNIFVLTDFFLAMNFQNQNLNLDSCVKILPLLEDMLAMTSNSSLSPSAGNNTEMVIFAAYKSLVSLATAFGELIRSTRSMISIGAAGVDLSREARLTKCNVCYEIFSRARARMEMVKYQYRQSAEIQEVLDQYQRLCSQYFPN